MSVLQKLVLASGSPRRVALLQQAGIEPDRLMPVGLDETPLKAEHPRSLAKRLAAGKAKGAHDLLTGEKTSQDAYVLGADTVVAVGRRILPKAEAEAQARACLELLSGRRHRVLSAVSLIDETGREHHRLSTSILTFKRLGQDEIDSYLESDEWNGKAGGYAIQGRAEAFVRHLSGSHSGVMGLPLHETRALLRAAGMACA